MPIPDFQPNGAPIPRVNLPYAEPNIPNARPTGLPPGMSPLPKTEPAPHNVPVPKPSAPGQPISKPLPKPTFGGKTEKPPREFPKTNTPRTPGTKPFVPTIPQLVRKVIEYVLEPQPTSDGTIPDYEQTVPEDEPYPDSNDEPELDTDECLSAAKYTQLQGQLDDSLTQITYFMRPGHIQDNFYTYSNPPTRKIARKTFLTSRTLVFSTDNNGYLFEYKEIGRETYNRGTPEARVTYKGILREGYRRTGDGKFVWGGWTVYKLGSFLSSDYPSMPSPRSVAGVAGFRLLFQGAIYSDGFTARADPCDPQADTDIQDPNDYDRTEDDILACKWKPENDADVNQLEMIEYEYQKFEECYLVNGTIPTPIFSTATIELPIGLSAAFLQILRLHNKARADKCIEVPPVYYWGLEPGNKNTIFAAVPSTSGQEIQLPQGCAEVGITFNASHAKNDTSLRDLKRISTTATNEKSFINVAQCWIIDDMGNAITREQIWVPSTILNIPMQYRSRTCSLRLLTKSSTVGFTVFDSGSRWKLVLAELS